MRVQLCIGDARNRLSRATFSVPNHPPGHCCKQKSNVRGHIVGQLSTRYPEYGPLSPTHLEYTYQHVASALKSKPQKQTRKLTPRTLDTTVLGGALKCPPICPPTATRSLRHISHKSFTMHAAPPPSSSWLSSLPPASTIVKEFPH